MANTPKDYQKLRAKIIARAWKDPRFKEKLLKNPEAAFKEMGVDLPKDFKVHVIEEKTNEAVFVVPKSSLPSDNLSDQEIEKIAAAGTCSTCSWSWNP